MLAIFTAYGRVALVRAMVEVRGTAPARHRYMFDSLRVAWDLLVNLFFDTRTYTQYIRNTLVNVGWDIQLSKAIREHNGSLVALRKSVIQHIGMEGMWSNHKKYDYSSTFQSTGTALENGPRQDHTVLRKALRFMNSFGRK